MKRHVAVLSFPYTSHPMVLAGQVVRLAAAAPNVHFSFLYVPSSNASIFPSHSKHKLPTNLKVYDIVSPPSGLNLEEEGEWYYSNAPQSYEAVIEAAEVEMGVPISCLLADFLAASATEIASKMGVEWIAVWIAAPYSLLTQVHTHAIIDHLRLHSQQGFELENEMKNNKKIDFVPGLSMMRVEDLPKLLFESGTGKNTAYIVRVLADIGNMLPKAAAVVLTCFEEENLSESTSVLRSKGKTLLQIGCCPATQSINSDDQSGCLSWLDQQSRPKSVVYVSFGTMSFLSPNEIAEIAEALEMTETPYLWSIRDANHLPVGFIERTRCNGKVVAWAPQTLVLSHPSVGAHLMHGGFGSIMESVMAEVPMIFRPIWADNMMNARMADEAWQIGVGVEGRVITKNELVKCLDMVLGGGEQGKMMRRKIKSLKKVMVEASAPDGTATKDFISLVNLISSI